MLGLNGPVCAASCCTFEKANHRYKRMKTSLSHITSFSRRFKMLVGLLAMVLNLTDLFSQVAAGNPILMPVVYYQQRTKSPVPKVYTVLIAKNFPSIESGEKPVLPAMDESENFRSTGLFYKSFGAHFIPREINNLALHYKTQKKTSA
jgi:hypothetical protein